MHLFLSGDKPSFKGCSWDELSELAPYVRVGTDTCDSFGPKFGTPGEHSTSFFSSVVPTACASQRLNTGVVMTAEYQHWLDGMLINGTETFEGAVEGGFSVYTREIAGSIRPHHFPDLASLLMGKVHKTGGPRGPE